MAASWRKALGVIVPGLRVLMATSTVPFHRPSHTWEEEAQEKETFMNIIFSWIGSTKCVDLPVTEARTLFN